MTLNSQEPILIEGLLKKKSPKTFLGRQIWQERYFVLTYSQLCYYKRKEDTADEEKCLGFLLIENIQGAVDLQGVSGGLRFNIVLEGVNRLFELEAPSRPLVISWVNAIKTALSKYGKKPVSLAVAATPGGPNGGTKGAKFWKPQIHKKIQSQRRAAISSDYLMTKDDPNAAARMYHKTGHERALILQALRDCSAFNAMDDEALCEVCNIMWESTYERGASVFTEGVSSQQFHVVVEGVLKASTTNPTAASPVAGHFSPSSPPASSFSLLGDVGRQASTLLPPEDSPSHLQSSSSNLSALTPTLYSKGSSLSVNIDSNILNSPSYTADSPNFRGTFTQQASANHLENRIFPGQFFGEVALMYDQTATHTVSAVEGTVRTFTLDRAGYKKLIASASERILRDRTNFLRSIPLFINAGSDLIHQVAESLEVRYVKAGQEIIREGQPGDEFYIMEQGRCTATCKRRLVCVYQRNGDFFGELALLSGKPRACTITADLDSKILYLSHVDFELIQTHLKPHLESRHGLYKSLRRDSPPSSSVQSSAPPADSDSDDDDVPPPPPPLDGIDGPMLSIAEEGPPPPPPAPVLTKDDNGFYMSGINPLQSPGASSVSPSSPKPPAMVLFDSPLDSCSDEPPSPPAGGKQFGNSQLSSDEDDDDQAQTFRFAHDFSDESDGDDVHVSAVAASRQQPGMSVPQAEAPDGLPTLGGISLDQRKQSQITLNQVQDFDLPAPPLPPVPFDEDLPAPPVINSDDDDGDDTYNPTDLESRLAKQKDKFGDDATLPKHMQRMSVMPDDPVAAANKTKLYEYGNGPNHVCSVTTLDDLNIIGTLGRGTFGHVQLVKDSNEHIYALKAVNKTHVVCHQQVPHILNERATMLELDHPFIVKLYRTLKDRDFLYFLLEPSLGGELFTVLRNADHFPNDTARFYAAIVVTVFQYMHSKDILYRDLKPENLLMDADGYIRVTDFGFAKKTKKRTYTFCGTPDYLAPEIVTSAGHHAGADWWCLGILIYEMLAGYTPFYDERGTAEMFTRILSGKVYYPSNFSKEAREIIGSLLQTKPTRRLGVLLGGADMIRKHAWFAGLDWDRLMGRELESPIPVNISSKFDLTNFDVYQEEENPNEPFVPDPNNPWDEVF